MSNSPSEPRPSRIIIDEDWKSQVERERETLQHGPGDAQPGESSVASVGAATTGEMPEVGFDLLVSMLITPALLALGQVVDPRQPALPVDLPQARLYIDLLAVLQERTRGNLSADEDQMLEAWINQLRMFYVEIYSRQAPPA
jgi:hypothetical protein